MNMRKRKKAASSQFNRGFTLLEVLISVTLLALLSTLLFLILDATAKLWRETEKRVDSYREARVALNLIARELRSMVVLDGNLTNSFLHNPTVANGVTLPATVAPSSFADSVFFTTNLPPGMQDPAKNRSDWCAVGYYLAWTPDAGATGQSSYKLYRHFKSSDDAFSALTNAGQQRNLFLGISTVVGNQNDIVARNIVGLNITPYSKDADGNLVALPAGDLWPPNERPALIEIEINAINGETSAKLANRSDWENAAHPLIKQASQSFTTRVVIPDIDLTIPTPTPTP
jgi:prepilin-type N-terminal cleavage/methylation domain-containing protein